MEIEVLLAKKHQLQEIVSFINQEVFGNTFVKLSFSFDVSALNWNKNALCYQR